MGRKIRRHRASTVRMELSTFLWRLASLALFLLVASSVEFHLRRDAAVRWRYSVFIAASALVGAAFGAAFDAFTSRLSPEYFSLFKGLGAIDVHRRASLLGAMAGANAGIVIAAVLSFVCGRRLGRCELPDLRQLLGILPIGALGSIAASVTLGLAVWMGLDDAWAAERLPGLTRHQQRTVVTAWFMHAGAYVGLLLAVGLRLWLRPLTGLDRSRI